MGLGFLFTIGLTAPVLFQSVAALAPRLIAQEGLTYTDIGVLTGIYMLPGVFLAAPSGPLAAWIGDRLTLVLGIALMAISAVMFALAESHALMLASRLLGGAGSVAVMVLLPKLVTDRFAGKEIATAMSIIAASVGLGIGLAMAVLPAIAEVATWRAAMMLNAGLCALAIVLLLAAWREDGGAAPTRPDGTRRLWSISRPELVLSVLGGAGRGLFSAGYAVFMSFLPALLIARGMPTVEAGLLTSVSALASLVSVPLGGYLSDKTGKPNHFVYGGSLATAATCILVTLTGPALLWVIVFGLVRGGCTGGLMTLPSQVLRPESRNTGFAVVSAVYFVCMAVFPAVAGLLLDATANATAPLWFAALLWFSISLLLAAFLLLKRRWLDEAHTVSPPAKG
jgi:cyanate permease